MASRRIGRISGASPRAAAACRMIRMCGAWCGGPGGPVACASRVVLVVPGSVRIDESTCAVRSVRTADSTRI